jgi:hypothetical protein
MEDGSYRHSKKRKIVIGKTEFIGGDAVNP